MQECSNTTATKNNNSQTMCLPHSTQFHPPPVRVKHGGGASSADVDDVEDGDALSQVPFSLSTAGAACDKGKLATLPQV